MASVKPVRHPRGLSSIRDDATLSRLATIAGSSLDCALPFEPWAPGDDDWEALCVAASSQRAWTLIVAADGSRLTLTPSQRAVALQQCRPLVAQTLELERALIEVVDELRAIGIEVRVLKGAAHAHILYRNPTLRVSSDVDLLVRSRDFDRAAQALVAAGGRRHRQERVPGITAAIGKGATIVHPAGLEIDLHRRIGQGADQYATEEEVLWAPGVEFTICGSRMESLPVEFMAAHACLHAVAGGDPRRLVPLRDVGEVLDGRVVDPMMALAAAERMRSAGMVAVALTVAAAMLGVERNTAPVAHLNGLEAAWLRFLEDEDRTAARHLILALASHRSPSSALNFVQWHARSWISRRT